MGTSRLFSYQQLGGMESMNHVSMDVEDDQALINKVGLKCPRCESTNTKFDFYQNHQESQPHHYCKDCRRGCSVNGKLRDIPVGGGERKTRQPDVSTPDHTQKGLKCPCCELSNLLIKYGVTFPHQRQKRDLEGSGEIASIEGCKSNPANNEVLEVIHTECSKSFSPSVVVHQPVSVCLQKFDSHIEKDSEGFHFVNEVTPTEEVNLSDTSRSHESPEASNVVENSSCGKKSNTFNVFGSNARGNEMAQLVSVDVATIISTQPNPEPLPLESSLPFIKSSFMWQQVESMEVYRFIPQQPHFEPLKEQNEHLREGTALGLMLSFPKLVEVTREAQLEDSRSMFDTKLKAVQIFEEYGFTVEPIRTQLVKLLQFKENCEQHDCMLKAATRGLTEVLESIALLEKDLQLLQEKKERQAFKVDELQRTSDQLKECILAARLKFHTLVAAPW